MPVNYEPWLVLLSIVMAVQGAYVGLSLAVQIGDAEGLRRRALLAARGRFLRHTDEPDERTRRGIRLDLDLVAGEEDRAVTWGQHLAAEMLHRMAAA